MTLYEQYLLALMVDDWKDWKRKEKENKASNNKNKV